MGFLQKLFVKEKKKESVDILFYAKKAGASIEKLVNDLFAAYYTTLISEPVTNIVIIVWGASQDGELTSLQKEIHERINPVVEEIADSLNLEEISDAQQYAVKYLVRDLLISKIAYFAEITKKQAQNALGTDDSSVDGNEQRPDNISEMKHNPPSPWDRRFGDGTQFRW